MKPWIIFMIMIIGTILFVFGGMMAYSFSNWNFIFFRVTIWRDVIIFSIISLLGLIMLIFGIIKIVQFRHNDGG